MLLKVLNDNKFNMFFSFMLGLGLVCIFRPMCSGKECQTEKPPISNEFDKYVYRMGSKCIEFKPEILECPVSGAIEAFRENILNGKKTIKTLSGNDNYIEESYRDSFSRRQSIITRCE